MKTELGTQRMPRWKRVFVLCGLALVALVALTLAPFIYLHFKNYFAECEVENRAARAYLVDALDLMQEYSINSNKLDWPNIRKAACETAKAAQTPAETVPAINGAITGLMDFHSFLRMPTAESAQFAAAKSLAYRAALKAGLDKGSWSAPEPSERLIAEANALPDGERYTVERHGFAMPSARIGYLSLDGFRSAAPANMLNYADTLAQAVDKLLPQSQCGVIVDLRRNDGGNMGPQFLGLHRLYGSGNVKGMRERGGHAQWVSLRERSYCHVSEVNTTCLLRLPASAKQEPDASTLPVAVLLSQTTASSAEAVALGFIGRPNTKTFGNRTYGATTSNLGIALRDGTMLFIATSEMTDRNGKTYPTHIVPDEVTSPYYPRISPKNADAITTDKTAQAAINWLKLQSSCGS